MNEQLRLSQEGANLVKAFESCLKRCPDGRYRPYRCPAGVLTIGWGHTNDHGRRFSEGDRWTRQECDEAFEEDMEGFEAAVKRRVRVPLNQHQFDALVSFSYNCGEGNLAKSGLLRKVNAGDHVGAAREFHKWTKGGGRVLPGLVRRRASESLLYQGIADRDYDGKPDRVRHAAALEDETRERMPQGVDEPTPPKSIFASKTAGIGAAIGGVEGIGALDKANQHLDTLNDAKSKLDNIASGVSWMDWASSLLHDPTMLIALAAVAGVVFIIWDRHRKLTQEHV